MPIVEVGGKKILFLHVPKTGGSSIEIYLQSKGKLWLKGGSHRSQGLPCSPQHLHAEAIQRHFPNLAVDWAFMVVRHPVERLVSQFKYQTRKRPWLRGRWTFSLWLRYVLLRRKFNPYYRDNHFRPQAEFEGYSAEICRYEEGLHRCLERVEDKLDILDGPALTWEKRSSTAELSLRESDVELIRSVYRKDFDRFGYE